MVRICFDYGHGGKDSGDNAIFDYKRKEIVHQLSKAIILGTKE